MPRIIRIDHVRCAEHSAWTFMAVPDDWTDEVIEDKLREARKTYLEYIRIAREAEKAPNDWGYGGPPYKKYPDRTVAEITAEWKEKEVVWKAWRADQDKTKRDFSTVLRELGFLSLWSDGVGIESYDVDWGHMHGTRLDYEDTKLDELPRPSKIVNPDEEDDDWL